jgi:hypothetical protein
MGQSGTMTCPEEAHSRCRNPSPFRRPAQVVGFGRPTIWLLPRKVQLASCHPDLTYVNSNGGLHKKLYRLEPTVEPRTEERFVRVLVE